MASLIFNNGLDGYDLVPTGFCVLLQVHVTANVYNFYKAVIESMTFI